MRHNQHRWIVTAADPPPRLLLFCAMAWLSALMLPGRPSIGKQLPTAQTYTNSIAMKFVPIEPGEFRMGSEQTTLLAEIVTAPGHFSTGDFDEHPAHKVRISRRFYIGLYEVTNAQYELFDPQHHALRGKLAFSTADDEAAVFVSWYDAAAFCEWLSHIEALPYRLPTEAEWEYACRAQTTTPFHTGLTLPRAFHNNVRRSWYPDPRTTAKIIDQKWLDRKEPKTPKLTVGKTPPNPWGLYDMHGNVEEWCHDWYGPYQGETQTDPVGRSTGDFKVTRGGSHSTELYYLRSANRMGTLPQDRNWYIGFRVVLGRLPDTDPLPQPEPKQYKLNVNQQTPADVTSGPDPSKPYFKGPRRYVKIPPGSEGPLFSKHNHDPGIAACPNGDLFTAWYTCVAEDGRELALAAARLRHGADQWDPASPFWDAPDRNDHCAGLWNDGRGTLYHFNGLSAAATWGSLAIIMRTSADNGANWSRARIIVPEHGYRQMVGEPAFRTSQGAIVFGADAVYASTVWVSYDNAMTWSDPGGTINGIHAGIVELANGCLMALGRGMNINGMMPRSISCNMGKTWQAGPSPLPPVSDGQRLALMRLKEGPLFLASFADEMEITDSGGHRRMVSGLFGALSFDDGNSWPVKRLITDDGPPRKLDGGAWTGEFTMDQSHAEPKGYMSVCQSADGLINLISSALHYQFNIAWLKAPVPPLKEN